MDAKNKEINIANVPTSSENHQDETDILEGENQNESVASGDLEPLENEPGDFMRGEVDVKKQIDKTIKRHSA